MDSKKWRLEIEPSPYDARDWIAESIYPPIRLPKQIDLRNNMKGIRNQGNQGSCAAHTAASMKEWQEKIDIRFDEYMSRQFVYDNRSNRSSSGMYPRDVMKILQKLGCCREKLYPYGKPQPKDKISEEAYKDAKNFVIKSYARINTIKGLKKALTKNGPCFLAVPVYNYGKRMWKPTDENDNVLGGHAMTVVGYSSKGFIIRNSWGKSWAFNGYTLFPYGDFGHQFEIWTTLDERSKRMNI